MFEKGYYVYFKVSPMRGLCMFNMKGKLATRYIGPYSMLARKCEVAYQLKLPEALARVHHVFYIPRLNKCLRMPEEQIPLEELSVKEDFT